MPRTMLNLTGQKFGRWTVLDQFRRERLRSGGTVFTWLCLCECGVKGWVQTSALRNGTSTQCTTCRNAMLIARRWAKRREVAAT